MPMPMSRVKILQTVGYVAFGAFALFVSFYLTFPAEAVGQRIANEVQRQTRGVWNVTFGAMSMYHLSGLEAENVIIRKNVPNSAPIDIPLSAARIRLRLLPLLLARFSVDAEVDLGDGTLGVRFTPRGNDAFDAHVSARDVDLATAPLLSKLIDVPFGGKISGDADTNWDADLKKSTGTASFSFVESSVGPATVQGFSIPKVDLGQLDLDLDLKDSKLKVTSFKQKGGKVALQLMGSAQLKQPLPTSSLDTCAALRADPAFLTENPKIRSALQLAEMQLKKDHDGFLHIPLTGMVTAPQLRPGLCRPGT